MSYYYEDHVVPTRIIERGASTAENYFNVTLLCKKCACVYEADARYGICYGREAYVASCPMPRCSQINYKHTNSEESD
jgi:hypothetical protein